MGCLSHRKKQTEDFVDQRWEYISLNDFKSKGCGTGFAYTYLWLSLIISVAVYGVDSFTAVQLLVFNRWSSTIVPAISFDVSKWIFSICILLSFINLGYEGFRARKAIKKGLVAACYLDNLAVRWESIRLGSGQGWRRFLVFAELTKSKKGAEYIALFTYFSFQTWIRVIVCSGPRQVLNALTLKSVYEAKLAVGANNIDGTFVSFFDKIKKLAEEDYRQAVILSGMCFTLIVWIFSALFLLLALCFWLFFLVHWIPRADGGLTGYCERKVTKTLMKIVTKKVNKALARQEADRIRDEFRAAKRNGEKPTFGRTATLPNVGISHDDHLPSMPMMGRNDTMATLPAYTSRPSTPGAGDQKRPYPTRNGTMASTASYSSRAPLVGAPADFGYGRTESPAPMAQDRSMSNYAPPRSVTSNSNFRSHTPASHVGSDMHSSFSAPFTESPGQMHSDTMPPFPPPVRSSTARTADAWHPVVPPSRAPTTTPTPKVYKAYNPTGRVTPPPPANVPQGPEHWTPSQPASRNAPMRSETDASYQAPQYSPPRNLTSSVPPPAQTDDFYDWSSSWQSRATPAPRNGTPQGQRGPPRNYDTQNQRGHQF